MRCQQCCKFVGQEPAEPQIDSIEIHDGEVTCDVTLEINCIECGSALKSGSFNMQETVPEDLLKDHQGEDHDIEVQEDGSEAIDEYETKDRHGKPIKNARYQTHLYGARVDFTVKCSCGTDIYTSSVEDKMAASNFDEC
jgi:hypothetical protein